MLQNLGLSKIIPKSLDLVQENDYEGMKNGVPRFSWKIPNGDPKNSIQDHVGFTGLCPTRSRGFGISPKGTSRSRNFVQWDPEVTGPYWKGRRSHRTLSEESLRL